MALTVFQRDICRLLADRRRAAGESYVAGGGALTVALGTARVSRDLDPFHDTLEAVTRSWDGDRTLVQSAGYHVEVLRERPGYVEALVSRHGQSLLIEWARDSAFRFFPLVEHDELGLTLHPFDLATNKVLALVGRLEVRDWVDVLDCDERLQPLGYLVWAACSKDPGFTPWSLLEHARRGSRYSAEEVSALAFEGRAPDASALAHRWTAALEAAHTLLRALPAARAGEAVLTDEGQLFAGTAEAVVTAMAEGRIRFHRGHIGGALPRLTH